MRCPSKVQFPYILTYEFMRNPSRYRGVVKCAATGRVMWKSSWYVTRRLCAEELGRKLASREGWN